MAPKLWTDEELARFRDMREAGHELMEIADVLGRSLNSVEHKSRELYRTRAREMQGRIQTAALNPPIETNDKDRIRQLESEVALLRQQLTWSQHSYSEERTGGKLTIRESDVHNADENHLLSCYRSVAVKTNEVIRQYRPDIIQLIAFDDWIAGSGIYREQDLHSAVADPAMQLHVGAMKARERLLLIREVSESPIEIVWLRGNHEYARGTSIAEALFYETRALAHDIPQVKITMHHDAAVVNLAAEGTYNVLAMHGFGHSNQSPNSNAFVKAATEKILILQRKLQPEQHIRRVLSGHTHWRSCGLERVVDLPFDTTGGFQRNTRVKLGMNQRPIGSIVYVSPAGQRSDILKPLEIGPEQDTQERELADPHLPAANRKDCAETLERYGKLAREFGLVADGSELGLLTEGRW